MNPSNARLSLSNPSSPEPHSHKGSDHSHVVQFYENEHFLSAAVSDFLAEGLKSDEPLVVIATEAHRDAFTTRLRSRGFDVGHATRAGRLQMLDARETLNQFMEGCNPDGERFNEVIGGLLERTLEGRSKPGIRAYGEMVDLLWKDGNTDGAVRLEELWNDLANTYSFKLLCAYAMGNFYKESHAGHFHEICRQHGQVFPTERYTQADDSAKLLEITLLQQRARALETEILHRAELELRLRDSLASRRSVEETLRRSEQELKDFLENAAEGIHWVAADGTVIWANRAEMELLGYTADEYIGHHIAEFHADLPVIEDILKRLRRNETLRDFEARLRCKDGSVRHVSINSNVLWRNGKFIHTRCFTRDITDMKRAAAEREKLLERERAARYEAETANRAKGDFLAVMSHELRTPLNAIGGHVQLIEMGVHGPVTDAQRESLIRIERSQRHLLALINDVLNLVRVENGHVEYQITDVDLDAVLKDVTSMVEPLATANQLVLEVLTLSRESDQPLAVKADRDKVQQIVLNLLTNAIKFTPPGGRISVYAAAQPEAPECAAIQVRDTGAGIPAGKLENIFEPFVQLAARPTSGQEGLGLGLAISRDLARGMGGELRATSDLGDGATFTLTLPRA
jgi:PAS domain S-box-containing protein